MEDKTKQQAAEIQAGKLSHNDGYW